MSLVSIKGGKGVVSPGLGVNNGGKSDIHQQNIFRVSTYTQVLLLLLAFICVFPITLMFMLLLIMYVRTYSTYLMYT
jgi:hypothetical protein